MTEEDYREEKRQMEIAIDTHKQAIEKLNEDIARLSKDYLKNLIKFDVGDYYLILLSRGMIIYFKWTEDCSFTYNDITNCFSVCMKTAIVVREDDVSFLNDYNFSTGIEDFTQELHKANEYHLNNLKAIVENKLKAFLPKE